MRKLTTWATACEITATATFFNCTINEFTNQLGHGWEWINIIPQTISTNTIISPQLDPPNDGIPLHGNLYLHHTNGNHYDAIAPGAPRPLPFYSTRTIGI